MNKLCELVPRVSTKCGGRPTKVELYLQEMKRQRREKSLDQCFSDFMDQALLKRAEELEFHTFVASTSVANLGGLGLYALRDFEVGERLPYPYPGRNVDAKTFAKLNDILFDMHVAYVSKSDYQWMLEKKQELEREYGFRFTEYDENDSVDQVHWSRLYDSFIAYIFESAKGFIYWPAYDNFGLVASSAFDPKQEGLFVNEPPPYEEFLNLLTCKMQASRANVEVRQEMDENVFRVIHRIRRGDEILLCYGPFYRRGEEGHEYKINLSTDRGCGRGLDYYYVVRGNRPLRVRAPKQWTRGELKTLRAFLGQVQQYAPVGDTFTSRLKYRDRYGN